MRAPPGSTHSAIRESKNRIFTKVGNLFLLPFTTCTCLEWKDVEFMGHEVFAGPVVLVGGVEAEVSHLAGIQASEPLHLHIKRPGD